MGEKDRGFTVKDLIQRMTDNSELEKTAAPVPTTEKTAGMEKIAETLEIYNLGRTFGIGFADGLQEQMTKMAAEAAEEQVPPAVAPVMAAPGTMDIPHATLAPTAAGVDAQTVAPQQIATQPLALEVAGTAEVLATLKAMTPVQIVQFASNMPKDQLLRVAADPEVANIIEGAMQQVVGVPNPTISNAVAGQ